MVSGLSDTEKMAFLGLSAAYFPAWRANTRAPAGNTTVPSPNSVYHFCSLREKVPQKYNDTSNYAEVPDAPVLTAS